MKATLVYITTFVLAFVGVTALLIFANEKFENIFVFNFAPKGTDSLSVTADSLGTDSLYAEDSEEDEHGSEDVSHNDNGELTPPNLSPLNVQERSAAMQNRGGVDARMLEKVKKEIIDSLTHANGKVQIDTVYQEIIKDRSLVDSLNKMIYAKSTAEKQLEYREREIDRLKKRLQEKQDSSYDAWVKQTVKLYEGMDAKKAAKILLNYSDNVAKDIIFKMKKKKASEILEYLQPEEVVKLTGAQ